MLLSLCLAFEKPSDDACTIREENPLVPDNAGTLSDSPEPAMADTDSILTDPDPRTDDDTGEASDIR